MNVPTSSASDQFDVTIAGEINLDLILYGLPEQLPLPRELLTAGFEATLGSSSAILAHNLAVLGARVGFITRVGNDAFGALALDRLRESGVDTSRTTHDPERTTGLSVLLHHGEARRILTWPGTMSEMSLRHLDEAYLARSRHFHLSSLFLQRALAPDLPGLFRRLKSAGLTLSMDTNDDPEDRWGGELNELLDLVDVLLPNEAEACRIAKRSTLDEALKVLGARVPWVAVKCGKRGCVVQSTGERFEVPGVAVDAVDTIGAGDSFNAGFLLAWLHGLTPDVCGRAGTITGALSTLRSGGTEAFRDRGLTAAFLEEHRFPVTMAAVHKTGSAGKREDDPFVALVTARAEVDLPLGRFQPVATLVTPEHTVEKPRFAAIDYHNHLDAVEPEDVLRVMDACGIDRIVNITMKTGDDALQMIRKFRAADANRFSSIAWMDWSGVERPDFAAKTRAWLERAVERGAKGIKFWKDLGLRVRDGEGRLLRIDDERLAPIFDKAAELHIPVMFHTADPDAFFLPIDERNERYEELAAHPDWSFYPSEYSKAELLDQRDRVIARHPGTTFVAAHVAESSENLNRVARVLDSCPNVYVDISARASELGRQPYRAREFFLRYSDRIVFGTDLLPEEKMYRLYFRFLETDDEYFEYPSHASRQGRWNIYGLKLPDDVLRRVYRENALRLLNL
jgi:sugar/nucleoside kinase (ribokinase family)/predicted TIM-barrel fold metal-dependent hydrolase